MGSNRLGCAIALASAALLSAAALAGCGGSGRADADGFTANDRRAATNVLSALAKTSVYDAARDISLTEAHVPATCVVHIQQSKPLTFRVFMTWIPNAEALGGPGTRSQRAYAWLDAIIGADGLGGDYAFHQGNERTARALRARFGDVLSKPAAKCLVLENQQFGLLPALRQLMRRSRPPATSGTLAGMRRRACASAISCALLGLFCGASSGVASNTALPICKQGQKSTAAKPCRKVVLGSPQPAANFIQDPGDTGTRVGSTDSVTVIRYLDPQRGLYQIEVANWSEIGYINTFNWVPPSGMTIVAVTSSEGGRCHLASGGMIACTGADKGIAPPGCTCRPGGKLTVNFTATGNGPTFNGQWWTYYGVVGGYTQITSMTPVPYHIPSYLPEPDVPSCTKGQVSTKAKPCATL